MDDEIYYCGGAHCPGLPWSDSFMPHPVACQWGPRHTDECTCGGVDIGVGVMHEPTCGYLPERLVPPREEP